jgi:hypothetical protein
LHLLTPTRRRQPFSHDRPSGPEDVAGPLLAPVCPAAEEDQDTAAGRAHPRDDPHLELVPSGDIAKGGREGRQVSGAACAHVTDISLKSRVVTGITKPDVEGPARSHDPQE